MASIEAHRVLSADSSGLRFDLAWATEGSIATAAEATRGRLALWVGEEPIWSNGTEFVWTWVELLEWLTRSWTRIVSAEGLPLDMKREPISAYALTASVASEAQMLPAPMAAELEMRLWEFLETHDVARALQGALPNPIVVWREGAIGHLLTNERHVKCRWSVVESQLTELGDAIAQRLIGATDDDRARAAVAGWEGRASRSADRVFQVAAGLRGLRAERALNLAKKLDLWTESEAPATSFNEFVAVARMTAGLPEHVTEEIAAHLSSMTRTDRTRLDAESQDILAAVDLTTGRPYEQGYEIANMVRMRVGLADDDRFNALQWLADRSVEYKFVSVESRLIDAFAAWGQHVGPAVFVNKRGDRSQSASSRNASLAHEICHLLVDRDRALSAAEVMGGRVNPLVEARANAAAAELLLPRAVAARVFDEADTVTKADRAVRSLSAAFVASREVVAWQAINSDSFLDPGVEDYLRSLTSHRHQV